MLTKSLSKIKIQMYSFNSSENLFGLIRILKYKFRLCFEHYKKSLHNLYNFIIIYK